jgi:anti-sigma factor RsiW
MNDLPIATHDPNEEDLVAYLDGELPAEDVRRVEERLSSDEGYRFQLLQLQRAWDMLDDLPRSEAGEHFSQSTVSMIALRTSGEFANARARTFTWRWGLTAAAVLFMGAAGYATTYAIFNAPNRELLADLPVIERLDAYQSAESIEFLRLLAQEGLFDEEGNDGP